VVPDLPHPNQTHKSSSTIRLLVNGNVSSIPGLIRKKHDQDEIEAADGKHHPENVPPFARAIYDEITEQGTAIWREQKEAGPEIDLAGVLVEVEHVLDVGESYSLASRQGEAHESPKGVESVKVVRNCACQREERSRNRRPEEYGRATPEVNGRDPEDTANTQHDDIEIASIIDSVRTHIPFCSSVKGVRRSLMDETRNVLDDNTRNTCTGAKVTTEG
jgi:hypothetical protein